MAVILTSQKQRVISHRISEALMNIKVRLLLLQSCFGKLKPTQTNATLPCSLSTVVTSSCSQLTPPTAHIDQLYEPVGSARNGRWGSGCCFCICITYRSLPSLDSYKLMIECGNGYIKQRIMIDTGEIIYTRFNAQLLGCVWDGDNFT